MMSVEEKLAGDRSLHVLRCTRLGWSLLLLLLTVHESEQGGNETSLYKILLMDSEHRSLSRPVRNEADAVTVSLGITLQQIVDIDEKNQILQLNVWLTYKWVDESFRWDPDKHGGVKELRLPPSKIWKPDVLLYNSADESFDSTFPSNVVVRHTGDMEWIPPGIIKSTCKIDITWFPFDDQRCYLKFGSWTFSGAMLDLRVGEVNNSTYTENGEWTLIAVIPARNEFLYDCCTEPYYDVTFTIWVRRRTLYYSFNLILPCLLISFMTLLDFTLPPESGEKLSLGVTIFMSLCVFLLMVAESMPPTSDAVPLIGTYFSSIMIVVSASVVFTVLVLNIHHRSPVTHEMSAWVQKVFLNWLPWLLMMKRPGYIPRRGRLSSERIHLTPGRARLQSSALVTKSLVEHLLPEQLANENGICGTSGELIGSNKPPFFSGFYGSTTYSTENDAINVQYVIVTHLEPVLQGIFREIRLLTKKMREQEEEHEIINDWKFAAMVVDRLSLIIFTTVLLVSTCAILFAAPHI